MRTTDAIDWSECPLVEVKPEQFELPPDRIKALLAYAKGHRVAHPV